MEASRARKGLTKGKLVMSFYRAAKPAASSSVQYNSSSSSNSSRVVINHDNYYVAPQPMHKVSEINGRETSSYTTTKLFENNNNHYGVSADESVDLKAASYISSVQERFRLDWVNS